MLGALGLAGALAVSVLATTVAKSDPVIIGLVDSKALVTIDPITRKVVRQQLIRGVDTRIVGLDVRPSDGVLYSIASNGEIYALNAQTGQSTLRSKLSAPWRSGITTTIDFNPGDDRLRVMGSNGVNVSVDVDNGKVTVEGQHKYKDGDINAGKVPKVVAGSHTRAIKGAQTVTLYVIDATTKSLLMQSPPSEGLLTTVGSLGVPLNEPIAFNIKATDNGQNAVLTISGVLYAVDLETGKATSLGKIEGLSGKLMDIAWTN